MRVDKAVYEEQLEKLQEQLVHVMLENQSLQAELQDHKKPGSAHRREIEQLKQENLSLQRRLRHTLSTSSTHASISSDDSIESGFENVTADRDRVLRLRQRRLSSSPFSYASLRESVCNFLALFSEEVRTSGEQAEEATPLTAKRLKENISRLGMFIFHFQYGHWT
jgi:FtsZ-binding cell division protein ZapB